jgi:lincosamide and streptogramin A transport system ATP-binding/permease protein
MSLIVFDNITFSYGAVSGEIFKNLSLNIDTSWRLGVIGRNGKGKTSLLYLINKKVEPLKGSVYTPVDTFYFPYETDNEEAATISIVRESVAPFYEWERTMETLLNKSDEESVLSYCEIQEKYQKAGGYEIDYKIEKEFSEIGLSADLLNKCFNTLSGGEQTRALITALFLRSNAFPLIDEPTNHLDMKGRAMLGDYLSNKNGFIVVSHDRYFLDMCIDHILSINKNDIRLNKGNYSQWKYNMDIEEAFELRKRDNLEREIHQLEEAARKRRSWSFKKEKEIIGAPNNEKGFISHRAAKLMKRAIRIEDRVDKKLEEKKSLLKNYEKERNLKIDKSKGSHKVLLNVENVTLGYNEQFIINNFSMMLREGERIAVIGDNGCGKTTLLRAILGKLEVCDGIVKIPSHISYIYARQNPDWNTGNLLEYLKSEKIDVVKFRNIMSVMGIAGDVFDKPLESFSRGEKKKIELSRSFLEPYDFLIWDEPMNYLDISSREQIECVLLKYQPTMLFTEHDRKFIDRIATRIIQL